MLADGLSFASMMDSLGSQDQSADTTAPAPAATSDDDHDGAVVYYALGGLLLVGGGIAAVAGGGGDDDTTTPTPPPPPPANVAPVFTGGATQAVTTDEDVAKLVTATATDADGDTLTYSVTTAAQHGTVTGGTSDGKFTYTPSQDYNGTDSFVVTVNDGKGHTTTQTINITVTPVNDAPTITPIPTLDVNEDSSIVIPLEADDVDDDDLDVDITVQPQHGTVTVVDNQYVYTPAHDYNGPDSFEITVKDAGGLTAKTTVNINVIPQDEVVSIDVGTAQTPVTFDAAGDNFKYTDDSAKATNVIIDHIGAGDQIEVTGASEDYSFTTVGNDIHITYNNQAAGVVNSIVLTGAAVNSTFVHDEASAEQAAGFDFFHALTQGGGNGSGDGVAVLNGDLDDDDDANVLTTAYTDAAGGDIAYTENANIANTVAIDHFTAGDTITVSGASTSAYSFASSGTDITITYNNNGVVNSITLLGANPNGANINNEASAEALIGSDFFKAAAVVTPPNSQSIDVGTAQQAVTIDASTASLNFTDDAAKGTNVVINGFTADDLISVTGATADDYSFTTDGTDLRISYNNEAAGVVNAIVIHDAVTAGFVADYASAVAAVGFNFMNFA